MRRMRILMLYLTTERIFYANSEECLDLLNLQKRVEAWVHVC
jgi:hypothetical protein